MKFLFIFKFHVNELKDIIWFSAATMRIPERNHGIDWQGFVIYTRLRQK